MRRLFSRSTFESTTFIWRCSPTARCRVLSALFRVENLIRVGALIETSLSAESSMHRRGVWDQCWKPRTAAHDIPNKYDQGSSHLHRLRRRGVSCTSSVVCRISRQSPLSSAYDRGLDCFCYCRRVSYRSSLLCDSNRTATAAQEVEFSKSFVKIASDWSPGRRICIWRALSYLW